jgi:hypothetical protein
MIAASGSSMDCLWLTCASRRCPCPERHPGNAAPRQTGSQMTSIRQKWDQRPEARLSQCHSRQPFRPLTGLRRRAMAVIAHKCLSRCSITVPTQRLPRGAPPEVVEAFASLSKIPRRSHLAKLQLNSDPTTLLNARRFARFDQRAQCEAMALEAPESFFPASKQLQSASYGTGRATRPAVPIFGNSETIRHTTQGRLSTSLSPQGDRRPRLLQ